ncbi:MAG TPA: hypothetical protein V6D12_01810 [Candidatus Obscuribacterales bacterium]
MGEVYTSAQVAQRIAVSAGTIRSWKARKPDQLVEGQHWVQQDGQTLWTDAGVAVLQQLATATGSVADPQRSALQDETEALQDRYSPLVDAVADALTSRLLQRIDQRVKGSVQRAIATPMTPAECISVLEDLGIKPADPLALIKGSNIAGLLNETTETGD